MIITIQTFGCFNISIGGKSIQDISIRRSKIWTALKFMIAHYKRPVSSDELIEILWPNQDCSDPSNSLKNIIHRLRKALSHYCGEVQCIVFSQGMYSWNPDLECIIDAAEFEELLDKAKDTAKHADDRAELYKKAIALYRGDYLRGEGSELWLVGFNNYYRRLFLRAVNDLADLHIQKAAFEEALILYKEAIEVEPYEEALYARQIEILLLVGDYVLAKQQYRNIEKLLRKEYGAEPSPGFQGLWLEVEKTAGKRSADLNEVIMHLDNNVKKSAILCGPETLKRIYSYHKSFDERVQIPAFFGMVSIEFINSAGKNNEELRYVIKTLRQIMLRSLRSCDIICQYSATQFVLMMVPEAEDKHKMAPLARIKRLFEKENDVSGITLSVQTAVGEDIGNRMVSG